MVSPFGSINTTRLDEALARDTEVKQVLHKEISDLKTTSEQLEQQLCLKTTQFEKLKSDFIFNLRLIKERDAIISRLHEQVSALKRNIYSRDIIISEIKVCLDRAHSELAQAKSSEAKLREDIEFCMRETVKREQQLLEKHSTVMEVLRKSEAEERNKLQNNINRLQSELETERLRFSADLQDTLEKATREREKLEADTSQKLYELELRIHLAEEATQLANKTRNDHIRELSSKNEQLTDLNYKLNEADKKIKSQILQIEDLQKQLKASKQRQSLLESSITQSEESYKSQRTELAEEINILKAKLEHYEQEMVSTTTKHEETVNSLKSENQRLLDSIGQEKQQTQKAVDMWKEEKAKCQHAESKWRSAENEVARLSNDLKQALIKPEVNKQEIVHCKHKDIINQIDYLQDTCDRLENENSRLKYTINIMSEQAKQVAQLTPEMTTRTDDKCIQQDEAKVNFKLLAAVKQIHQLALEKKALIELSNRLQAKLRQLTGQKMCCTHNEQVNTSVPVKNQAVSLSNDGSGKVLQTSTINKHPVDSDNNYATNKIVSKDKLTENIVDIEQTGNVNDIDSSSGITGKGSISTVFRLLDEAASLGSGNECDILHGNGLFVHGMQKRITTSKPKLR
uniref:Uncharacterized protein n=1 Tax=Trichobilharzia regenti TaxID=157069 RepID=A0AA85JE59_TRIRE|nr:unnamed protein product [Trichobilharzia regenti]